jgi:hypothetical protein
MKTFLLLITILYGGSQSFAQDSTTRVFKTLNDAYAYIKKNKYKTSAGWVISRGDELKLTKGSMPDKTFAFIYKNPDIFASNQHSTLKLPNTFNGRSAQIAQFQVDGSSKSGYYITATLKVGEMYRYVLDIENAIEAGEIEVPAEFAKKAAPVTGTNTVSLADELKKLKELLDSGALTKEEYDLAKKKVLGQ